MDTFENIKIFYYKTLLSHAKDVYLITNFVCILKKLSIKWYSTKCIWWVQSVFLDYYSRGSLESNNLKTNDLQALEYVKS